MDSRRPDFPVGIGIAIVVLVLLGTGLLLVPVRSALGELHSITGIRFDPFGWLLQLAIIAFVVTQRPVVLWWVGTVVLSAVGFPLLRLWAAKSTMDHFWTGDEPRPPSIDDLPLYDHGWMGSQLYLRNLLAWHTEQNRWWQQVVPPARRWSTVRFPHATVAALVSCGSSLVLGYTYLWGVPWLHGLLRVGFRLAWFGIVLVAIAAFAHEYVRPGRDRRHLYDCAITAVVVAPWPLFDAHLLSLVGIFVYAGFVMVLLVHTLGWAWKRDRPLSNARRRRLARVRRFLTRLAVRIAAVLGLFSYPPVPLLYLLVRYDVGEALRTTPVLYLRSFHHELGPRAFGQVVAPAARRAGMVRALVHDLQPASVMNAHSGLGDEAESLAVDDPRWQDWVKQQMASAWAIVIDVSERSPGVEWEVEVAGELHPKRTILVAADDADAEAFAEHLPLIRYGPTRRSLLVARSHLRDFFTVLLRGTRRPTLTHLLFGFEGRIGRSAFLGPALLVVALGLVAGFGPGLVAGEQVPSLADLGRGAVSTLISQNLFLPVPVIPFLLLQPTSELLEARGAFADPLSELDLWLLGMGLGLCAIVQTWMWLALCVKRWHDRGYSGWLVLLGPWAGIWALARTIARLLRIVPPDGPGDEAFPFWPLLIFVAPFATVLLYFMSALVMGLKNNSVSTFWIVGHGWVFVELFLLPGEHGQNVFGAPPR